MDKSSSQMYSWWLMYFMCIISMSKAEESSIACGEATRWERTWSASVRLLYHSEFFEGAYSCALHTALLSLLIVISILSAIFPSRAAPAHAGIRLRIITFLFYGWMDFECKDDAIFREEEIGARSVRDSSAIS